ncbi:hypothetical protein O181_060009 [Austropuccinia psidii MF-1]|uniref:Uncharacterized protein n=1 Tax=Austropuccinia psidii MF-1 TaxID=1389203 RepID=A0A9Q3EFG5_9BASI|nr:hypothetical protein [Austropuccinia psidii MF-1]
MVNTRSTSGILEPYRDNPTTTSVQNALSSSGKFHSLNNIPSISSSDTNKISGEHTQDDKDAIIQQLRQQLLMLNTNHNENLV